MKTLFCLFCWLSIAVASVSDDFKAFKAKYDKVYNTKTEHGMRLYTFAKNVEYINKHNEEAAQGKHTFTLAVNKYADLTNEEWRETLLGLNVVCFHKEPELHKSYHKFHNKTNFVVHAQKPRKTDGNAPKLIPDNVDWRDQGYVTGVKDQKSCGSCWAFSATGSMEGAIFKKTGILTSLSEQNLVDCDKYSDGCSGGLMDTAFRYARDNGINTEDDYSYHASDETCKFDTSNQVMRISSYKETMAHDEDDLTQAIADNGPVSVAIDAGKSSFHFYSDGVYYDADCSSERLNHGVLAVGYSSDNGNDYYIVKNSWGHSWGKSGYIWMSRGRDNNCGIATDASYAIA